MEISLATTQDLDSLVNLWGICFHDTEYPYSFFTECFQHSNTYIWKDDEMVVSSITIIPINYKKEINNHSTKGLYLYGVCTLPPYRGKHLTIKLIEYVIQLYKDKDAGFIITRPANISLFGLYEKYGFNLPIFRQYIDLPITDSTVYFKTLYSEIRIERFKELREKYLYRHYFKWEDSIMQFILTTYNKSRNGIAAELPYNIYMIGAPHYVYNNVFEIDEINMEKDNQKNCQEIILNLITTKYPTMTSVRIYRPLSKKIFDLNCSVKEKYLVLRPINASVDNDAFFNFAME